MQNDPNYESKVLNTFKTTIEGRVLYVMTILLMCEIPSIITIIII